MARKLLIIVTLPALLTLLIGCGKTAVLHPISGQDIQRIPAGETFEAPKDGWFFSDEYVKKVMKVKVDDPCCGLLSGVD